MAKSRFEYVKLFEQADFCLRNCWIVVRLDGRCFHKFSTVHQFRKPNDERALNLMNHCSNVVMKEFPDIIIGYGQSDEYSKLMTNIVSTFSSSYVYHWKSYFDDNTLTYPPTFDGRVVLYPSDKNLRDYLSWRQADCHVNNLYNTCFWSLVQQGAYSEADAEKKLRGTDSGDKNELLFKQFGINYDNVPAMFKKGSTLMWKEFEEKTQKKYLDSKSEQFQYKEVSRKRRDVIIQHVDLISDHFWIKNSAILSE